MGNHYHLVVEFEAPRELTNQELMKRALRLYPRSTKDLRAWSEQKWKRLQERLFDVSEYMRNIQSAFARWYNQRFDRQGRFWADRFKSVLLGDGQAVLDCMLYVDLNAVRSKSMKVVRPEDYSASSIHLREIGKAGWLKALREIVGGPAKTANAHYKGHLYYRGEIRTKEKQAVIPSSVVRAEEARGFKRQGAYRKRLRYFTDGVVLGAEDLVLKHLNKLRQRRRYKRRVNPIPQESGQCFTLREQRSHAR